MSQYNTGVEEKINSIVASVRLWDEHRPLFMITSAALIRYNATISKSFISSTSAVFR